MKIQFKRAIGSVFAFVVLCSIMCIINVGSVFAANESIIWDFTGSDTNVQYNTGETGTFNDSTGQIPLLIDATEGKFHVYGAGSVQVNNGTIIRVPIHEIGDIVTVFTYRNSHTFTVSGSSVDSDMVNHPVTINDIANSKGYVEIKATADSSYLLKITLTPKPTKATWNFVADPDLDKLEPNIQGKTGSVDSIEGGIALSVDATVQSGKFAVESTKGAQFNSGTIVQIPIYTINDKINIISDTNAHNYKIGDKTADNDELSYTATETDFNKGYVEIVATGTAFIKKIILEINTDNVFECYNVIKSTDGGTVYVVGKVSAGDLDAAKEVGFRAATTEGNAYNENAKIFSTPSVSSKIAKGEESDTILEDTDGTKYFAAFELTGMSSASGSNTVYIVPFSVLESGSVVYSRAQEYVYSD